jgi:hypothetical protein
MDGNRDIVKDKTVPEKEIVKGMDLRMAELNDDIITAINKANLPAKVLVYVFTDFLNLMKNKSNAAVSQQKKEYDEALKGVKQDGQSVQPD